MRLIDADALKERLKSYTGMFIDELAFVVNLEAVLDGIDFRPTVEAAPVVHGKWVKYSFSCVCTQCETEFDDDDIRRIMGEGKMPNFCPECGADMRKGRAE